MRFLDPGRAMAALLAAALAAAPLALAPMSAGAQTAQPLAEAPAEAEVESFALAMIDVQKIVGAYQQRLSTVGDEAEAEAIRREASLQMVEAVEAQGLEVSRYNAIAEAAREDQDLARAIQDKAASAME